MLRGDKNNLYPYIANADMLLSTSLSEGQRYTINKAKVLGILSVIRIGEQQKSPLKMSISSIENIHETIIEVIVDKSLLENYRRNISGMNYDKASLLELVNNLI